MLLAELLVALMLAGTVATVLPVALNAVYRHRRQERFERLTQLELSNVVARLEAADGSTDASDIRLSDWFQRIYPDAAVEITWGDPQSAEITLIPVTVTIHNPRRNSEPPWRQQLTSWLKPAEVFE